MPSRQVHGQHISSVREISPRPDQQMYEHVYALTVADGAALSVSN